jgi:hypothetical protein
VNFIFTFELYYIYLKMTEDLATVFQAQIIELHRELHTLQQQQLQAPDPLTIFQNHLDDVEEREGRKEHREAIRIEAQRITKCDGSDPTLVRAWIEEVELCHPPQGCVVPVIVDTVSGAFRQELEHFLDGQLNRDTTAWAPILDHLLAAFVSTDATEYQRAALTKITQGEEKVIVSVIATTDY